MADPTMQQIVTVARAICRRYILTQTDVTEDSDDLVRAVDLCWHDWKGEAKDAIAAYEAVAK